VRTPAGFRFAGLHAGIKPHRKDLALVVCETPCVAAGVFTANRARAAHVLDAEPRLPAEGVRAVLVASGNANALTGPEGVADVLRLRRLLALQLGTTPEAVVTAATGVIGHRLPMAKLEEALPRLAERLSVQPEAAAEAILTTDTRIKVASRTLTVQGREVTISAIAKGSGMIAPQLATVLAVIMTDAALSPSALQAALRAAMQPTFNCLTVDGDMSTNDTVYALASGTAGHPRLELDAADQLARVARGGEEAPTALPAEGGRAEPPSCDGFAAFTAALTDLCRQLAREVAADGEGATRLLEIAVGGAADTAQAVDLARAVAGSPLVKAAMFGADPNWGRVMATLGARAGTEGYDFDPARCQVTLQGVTVYAGGGPRPFEFSALRARLRAPEVKVEVSVGGGPGQATAYGCDLSYDYVKLNADYSSLIVPTVDGSVAKDDRLTNYSPAFKVSLIVEALSYISRFTGQRCVVKCGGAALVKESLKKAFCDDIKLLRSVGLRPVVVHGGGPELAQTLEKLGHVPELVDGLPITHASDLKVVEMVLSGAISSGLVTLLNQEEHFAVGVSGKDGGLLRARRHTTADDPHLAAGPSGSGQGVITQVNKGFLDMLVGQGYVPVISPIAIGEDGQSYHVDADQVAAAVAVAFDAPKLIFLSDTPGLMQNGELVGEVGLGELERRLGGGELTNGMRRKALAARRALAAGSGVQAVHVVDGRAPHSLIGELFTDRGVGTLVRRDA
jgi:acetylglutamate kinase